MEKNYDQRVQHLENIVSYGTLGIIERICLEADTHNKGVFEKYNTFLINVDTVIRNSITKDNKDDIQSIIKLVMNDLKILCDFFTNYMYTTNQVDSEGLIVLYFHPPLYQILHENIVREYTDSRKLIRKIADQVVLLITDFPDTFKNKIKIISQVRNIKIGVMKCVSLKHYNSILSQTRVSISGKITALMLSFCPLDYFIYPIINFTVIDSHTGNLTKYKDLNTKVFSTNIIPFNMLMYRVLGDKHFIKPLCRNKPKFLKYFEDIKISQLTNKEIITILVNVFKINSSDLERII